MPDTTTSLRVLIVEDRISDAELMIEHLRGAALVVQARVVDTEADYLAALDDAYEVILSDYRLPQFNGLRAFKLLQERGLDIPFILVSATLGEELAVDAIRRGADDYLMKDRLSRLGTAVTQALERKQARVAIEERKRQLATLISNLPGVVYRCRYDEHYTVEFVSDGVEELTGYPAEDFRQHRRLFGAMIHPDDQMRVGTSLETAVRKNRSFELTYRFLTAGGAEKWIWEKGRGIRDSDGHVRALEGFFTDITERKQAEEAQRRSEQRLQESETRYRELVEQASDGIVVYDKDRKFVFANSRARELLGYTERGLLGSDINITYCEAEEENQVKRMEATSAGQVLRYERMMKRRDGSVFAAEVSLKQLDNGEFQAIFHDITIRRAREHKITRLTRLHRTLSGIGAAIVRISSRQELLQEICRIAVEQGGFSLGSIKMLDPADGKLQRVAQAGLSEDFAAEEGPSGRPLGLAPTGISAVALRDGRPAVDNAIEPAHDETIIRQIAIRTGQKSAIALPLVVGGATIGILSLYAPERDFFDEEETKLLTGLAQDISLGLELIAKDEKVQYLSQYDPLTGLPNRSLFFERLPHDLDRASREGQNVALILIDLDRFRMINDTHGRKTGDLLIAAVAQRIRVAIGEQETIARVGADSFAMVISGDWQLQDVARAVEMRAHALFGQPFVLDDKELRVSATVGVAVFPGDADMPGTLFANAEAALRNATTQNVPLRFYGAEMNAQVAESLRLESRLRSALENDELVLWYQPKISARTGELTGFEALMRWQDPETGLVPPAKFIPLMEQTGLILEAGRWALSQVARDCRIWTMTGVKPPRVAVNVSPFQLRQQDFVDTVIAAAVRTREAGSMLDLEITESAIMEGVEAIISRLKTICGLGVEISVDDFGTGYSSLAYIGRLPIHALKIDRSFVAGMPEMNGSLSIVTAVISLAHSLKLQVVAEGVETETQAALLEKLGCDELQGYLISRPMPPEAIPEFLRQWKGRRPVTA